VVTANKNLGDADLTREGIEQITPASAQAARAAGREIRLVARCWKSNGRVCAEVLPRELPAAHPLAQVRGENNMLRLELETGEELLVSGKGAGRWPTSESVFADLMDIFRYRNGRLQKYGRDRSSTRKTAGPGERAGGKQYDSAGG
jgi:homoserine dehydrogenase